MLGFLTFLESFLPHVTVLMQPLIIPTISSPISATYSIYNTKTKALTLIKIAFYYSDFSRRKVVPNGKEHM